MVKYLIEGLAAKRIVVKPFMLIATDVGELAMALADAVTIIIGSPTVLLGAHPAVVYASYLTNLLRPKTKIATIVGSYGWKGKLVDEIVKLLPNLKADLLEPVIIKGKPTKEDYHKLDQLIKTIATKHKELGFIP